MDKETQIEKEKTKNELFFIVNKITNIIDCTDNELLRIDLIRVINDMRLAINNYMFGCDNNRTNIKLIETKNLLDNINSIIDDIIINNY